MQLAAIIATGASFASTTMHHALRRQRKTIIHVSGMPGSGKTTLGEELKAHSTITVYDTDEFIRHDNDNGALLQALIDRGASDAEYAEAWRGVWTKEFRKAAGTAETTRVVFVGILDHWGPESGEIFDLQARVFPQLRKYYIDVSLAVLMSRYYRRLCTYPDQHWEKTAKGEYHVTGSRDMAKSYEVTRKVHEAAGYSMMNAADIVDSINRLGVTFILYQAC
jgi:adenylate kinase family enzyme